MLLDTKEATREIGISERTLRLWASQDDTLPRFKVGPGGRLVRFDLAELKAWLEQQRVARPSATGRGRPRNSR